MHEVTGTRNKLALYLKDVDDLLERLNQGIDTDELKKLLLLRRRVDRFSGKIDEFRDCITMLLDKLSLFCFVFWGVFPPFPARHPHVPLSTHYCVFLP